MTQRTRPGLRDVAWLLLALLFAVLTLRYLWDIAALITTGDGGTRDVALLVVLAAVLAAGGGWLTWGAWRRTRWGQPDGED